MHSCSRWKIKNLKMDDCNRVTHSVSAGKSLSCAIEQHRGGCTCSGFFFFLSTFYFDDGSSFRQINLSIAALEWERQSPLHRLLCWWVCVCHIVWCVTTAFPIFIITICRTVPVKEFCWKVSSKMCEETHVRFFFFSLSHNGFLWSKKTQTNKLTFSTFLSEEKHSNSHLNGRKQEPPVHPHQSHTRTHTHSCLPACLLGQVRLQAAA